MTSLTTPRPVANPPTAVSLPTTTARPDSTSPNHSPFPAVTANVPLPTHYYHATTAPASATNTALNALSHTNQTARQKTKFSLDTSALRKCGPAAPAEVSTR